MKKLLFSAMTAAIFVVPAYSQAVAEGVPATKESHEVFATISKWADAVRDRDTKALDALFEEGLIITTADGKTRGRAEELELFKPNPQIKTRMIKNEDVKVRVFGQTAVATGLNRMDMLNGDREVRTAFRYTAVFLNKYRRWQLVALHTGPAGPRAQ